VGLVRGSLRPQPRVRIIHTANNNTNNNVLCVRDCLCECTHFGLLPTVSQLSLTSVGPGGESERSGEVSSKSNLRILQRMFGRLLVALCGALLASTSVSAANSNSAAPPCHVAAADGTCYGHALTEKYFLLGQGFTNLNHGSFGTVANPVASSQRDLFLEQESHPDTWFRVTYYEYIAQSRALLAGLINASTEDLVLVENASSAVNSLLRSLNLVKGDKVLRLSTAYGMVTNTLTWLEEVSGIEVVVVNVDFPMTDESQLLTAVQAAYDANPDIKLSIFSHISSMPGESVVNVYPCVLCVTVANLYEQLSLSRWKRYPRWLEP
jgi:hypothetical protein